MHFIPYGHRHTTRQLTDFTRAIQQSVIVIQWHRFVFICSAFELIVWACLVCGVKVEALAIEIMAIEYSITVTHGSWTNLQPIYFSFRFEVHQCNALEFRWGAWCSVLLPILCCGGSHFFPLSLTFSLFLVLIQQFMIMPPGQYAFLPAEWHESPCSHRKLRPKSIS